MSNFNKVVTNLQKSLSNAENDNLSQTLSAVRTAGGGGGGTSYGGDGIYIEIVGNNTITLTTTAAEKLNRAIPTTVAELTDSGDYATKDFADAKYQTKEAMSDYAKKTEIPDSISAFDDTESVIYSYINPATAAIEQQLNFKQNKLTFDLNDKGEISAIGTNNTTALVGANGITGDYYSASNPSGFITSSVSQLDNFYSKTDTSSKTEIANAFDNIPKYILNGDSNITATSAQDGKNIRWDLAVNAHPTVTDTTLTGVNGIYTHTTTKSGEWCVELVQSAYAAINDVQNKLDTTVAAQTYQPKGDYVSSTEISDMATKTWVGTQGYITVIPSEYVTDTELQTTLEDYATKTLVQNTSANITALIPSTAGLASETDLQIVSAGVDYVSAHAITAHQSLTNYYTKSETSGASELSTEFGKYALKSEIPTVPTKVSDLTDSANYYKTTETSSKNELSTEFAKYQPTGNYLVADDITGKLDKSIYANASGNWENTYNVVNQYSAAGTWLTAHQNLDNYYTKTQVDSTFASATQLNNYLTTAQYQTDSATFALKTDLNDLVSSAGVTTTDTDYVMTTTGWKVLTLPGGGMTQVIHDTTLTGQGNANDSKLGVAWSALSGNTINSALSAGSAASAYIATHYYDPEAGGVFDISEDINRLYSFWENGIMPDNGISGVYNENAQTFELGLTQTAYNAITSVSSKLDTTAAAATYQPKGDYYSASNPNNYVNESYITSILAGYAEWEDFENLSADVQNKLYASAAAQTYLTTATYANDSAKFLTGVVTGVGLSGTGLSNSPLGIDTGVAINFTNGSAKSAVSAGSATNAVSADKAASASAAKRLQDSTTGPIIQVGDVTALQNWASSNSSTWDNVSAKLGTAQYALDSATFVTSSNASISAAGEQYALTTTGWAKVQAGGGSTVTIDTTNNEIKDGTSAVSAMSYVVNPNNAYWKPQRSCVCTEAEISTMAGYANGQGMLFFVVSGHN